MIIPPVRWGDILLRSTDRRSVSLSEREQYLLYMIASWIQMNPSVFISDYRDYSEATVNQFLDETMNSLFDETTPPAENHMQTYFNLFAQDIVRGVNDAGSSPTMFNDSIQRFGYVTNQNPAALNDQMHYTIYMDTGDYSISHLYQKNSSAGKLTTYVWKQFGDGAILTPLSGIDMYAASLVRNQVATGTFTITEMGEYKIVHGVPAKNASSSGYFHYQTMTTIRRTGAL